MTIAEEILIFGGIINLCYGFLTGFVLAAIRTKSPQPPKYLMFAHIGPLMQGAMLLGLVWALQLSNLPAVVETAGATLLATGACLLAIKDTVLWWQLVGDEFADKPILGNILGGLSILTSTTGLGIIAFGVIRAFIGK